MSTEQMTIEAAAKHLGVSERTVRKFISDGFLSTSKQQGSRRKWLVPREVEELRLDRIDFREGSRLTRKEFMRARSRIRALEGQMEVVLRMLDVKTDPLRMDASYARELHSACLAQTQRAEWDTGELSSWVQIFLRISEEDFKTLKDATEDPKPWVPYLRLCNAMSAHIVGEDRYDVSLELQGIHRQLAEGRRRLRVSAMCFEDLYSYQTDPVLQRLSGRAFSAEDTLKRVLRKTG